MAIGTLVNLSPKSTDKSSYPNYSAPGFNRLSLNQQVKHLEPEFDKMLGELENLEKHIQKQDWYQDLVEVYTVPETPGVWPKTIDRKLSPEDELPTLRDIQSMV